MDPLWNKKLEIIKKHGIDNAILDLGCNIGDFSSYFVRNGYDVTGVDIDNENLLIANSRGIHTKKCNLNLKLPMKSNSYPTIFALEIIEHLINPDNVIKEAHRLLKDGGKFYVSVPYFGLVKRTAISLFFFDDVFLYNGPHIRFFSEKSFRNILTKNGFKILKIYKLGRFYPVYMDMLAVCSK